MKVTNLINTNGNRTANQFVITLKDAVYFQSYDSVICCIKDNKVILSYNWDYSTTTSKHLHTFLRQQGFRHLDSKRAILKAIKNGDVILKETPSLGLQIEIRL